MKAVAMLLAVAAAGTTACERRTKGGAAESRRPRGPTVFPVEVVVVTPREVDYVIEAPGTIEAFETVQVTARVAGVVDSVRFKEGDKVKVGRSLVAIEPQRYNLAVLVARASLEKARAAKADAEAGVERRESAVARSPGLIPGEEVATWRTRVRTADAEVAAAEAALANAELNLRDAYVRAPVAGVIETRTVQTGQYVQAGTVMATLVRRDPLLLRFTLSNTDAGELSRGMKVGFKVSNVPAAAEAFTAEVTHVAEAANQASRMVTVTAQIENPDDPALRPGGFAEVKVSLGERSPAPAIPETAIRPSEAGFVAYVVEGNRAVQRILRLGLRTADGMVEVKAGLSSGERVVVRGAEALSNGAEVRLEGGQRGQGTTAAPGGKPPA